MNTYAQDALAQIPGLSAAQAALNSLPLRLENPPVVDAQASAVDALLSGKGFPQSFADDAYETSVASAKAQAAHDALMAVRRTLTDRVTQLRDGDEGRNAALSWLNEQLQAVVARVNEQDKVLAGTLDIAEAIADPKKAAAWTKTVDLWSEYRDLMIAAEQVITGANHRQAYNDGYHVVTAAAGIDSVGWSSDPSDWIKPGPSKPGVQRPYNPVLRPADNTEPNYSSRDANAVVQLRNYARRGVLRVATLAEMHSALASMFNGSVIDSDDGGTPIESVPTKPVARAPHRDGVEYSQYRRAVDGTVV